MEADKIVMSVFVISLMISDVQASKLPKKEIKTEKKQQNEQKKDKFFIRFYDDDFLVSEEALKKFEAYKIAEDFEKKASTKEYSKSVIKDENSTTWDITRAIQEGVMPKKPSKKYWKLFTNLIESLIDIVQKKANPYDIHDKNVLFMIIKIADLLQNKELMRLCIPPLVEKLWPIQAYLPTKTFNVVQPERLDYLETEVTLVPVPGINKFFSYKGASICFWEVDLQQKLKFAAVTKSPVLGIIPFPKHEEFFLYFKDGMFIHYSMNKNKIEELQRFTGHKEGVRGIVPLRKSKRLLSYSKFKEIKIWSLDDGNESLKTFHEEEGVRDIVSLPNKEQFLLISKNTIQLRNPDNLKILKTFKKHSAMIQGLVFLDDGKSFFSYDDDGIIILWSIEKSTVVKIFKGHASSVEGIIPLPNRQFLSYDSGNIKLWHLDKKKAIRTFKVKKTRGIVFLPGDKQFLTYSYDGVIRILNLNDAKKPVRKFQGNKKMQYVTFTDETHFISYSDGNIVQLWNLYPFADLTFKQIDFCFNIFSEKDVKLFGFPTLLKIIKFFVIKKNGSDYKIFKSLPIELQQAIEKSKRIEIVEP